MSDKFSILRRLSQKVRTQDFDATDDLANLKKTPQTKVDSLGKKRVVISDDSEVIDWKISRQSDNGASRFRLRRMAVQREEGRRRLRWFTIVGTVVAAVVVILLLLTSPILSVRQVDVEGVVYADPQQIAAIVDSINGEPILTVDLGVAETKLLAIPWVRLARVSMHLPSRVSIEVVERTPVAFFRAVDGFNRVIDRDGRVLDVIEGDPTDYIRIIGTGPNLSAGQMTEQPLLGAAELINALPSDLRIRLLSLTVSPEGEVSLSLTNDVEVIFGRPDDFQVKLVAVVNEIKRQGTNRYAVIDVSSGQPSVR
ncbi:MAG: FtsQ-type POTRA domain-containing protein [Actinomycetota bacterium]|nr:FtsQ-type POTRA domain-containing protein [Actinomycetota bacterium]MDA3018907.1 FtsQ-type POTRA domain-containing protein [Actinomycetota bacterium]